MQLEAEVSGLTAPEFHDLMKRFALPVGQRVGLAVSGGPDSMALAVLAKAWAEQNGFPPPMAFIVDHALRTGSAEEAATVKTRLQNLGIDTKILHWEHEPIFSRLHQQARQARYRLLLDACRHHGVLCLLFGHQREDQAETILMRFAKGSGVDGLVGIPAEAHMDDVRILRPLLSISKTRLVATCVEAKVDYVTDPSNNLEKFARGRLRRVMPLLRDEGLTIDRIIDFGARAAETRDVLDFYTTEFLKQFTHQDDYGVITIDKKELSKIPRAIALRSLSLALQNIYTEEYPPTRAALSLLLDAVRSEEEMPPYTLNGCLVSCRQDQIVIIRELSAVTETKTIDAGQSVVWDGRWRVSLSSGNEPAAFTIKALGNPPHEVLDRLCPDLRHKVPQGRIRAVLPALWLGDDLALLPFGEESRAVKVDLLAKWPTKNRN